MKTGKMDYPSISNAPPDPVALYSGFYEADSDFVRHRHSWGQLNCVLEGVASYYAGGDRVTAFPGSCVWFPAGLEHACFNHQVLTYRVLNVHLDYCAGLPQTYCNLGASDIFRAVFNDLFARGIKRPETERDLRLSMVLIDELRLARPQENFLPTSAVDPLLKPIIRHLESNPGDDTPLSGLAAMVFSTERTVARRFQKYFGMTFRQWRQRFRFFHALALLEQGSSVEDVALSVGYSTSSAFIYMFQQFAGVSPEKYRARAGNE